MEKRITYLTPDLEIIETETVAVLCGSGSVNSSFVLGDNTNATQGSDSDWN